MDVEIAALELPTVKRTREAESHSRASHVAPEPDKNRRPGKRVLTCGVLFLFAALSGAYGWWLHASRWIATDNAYVTGHIHQVSSRVAGTVVEVLAEENAPVAEGAVIARLDRRDLEMERAHAAARLQQADAVVLGATSEVARARAALAEQQAELRKAELDLHRAKELFQNAAGAISRQEFDHTTAAFEARQAGVNVAASVVESARATAAAAAAQRAAARAELAEIDLQLGYTEIMAPAVGRIGRKNIEVGNRVQPGQALFGLVGNELWITANFKETELDRLRLGQAVRVRLDAFPERSLAGRVKSFSPASGAQFALLPPDNATGNFLKIVQRVPVRIDLNPESLSELKDRVVPGMSAVVEVRISE